VVLPLQGQVRAARFRDQRARRQRVLSVASAREEASRAYVNGKPASGTAAAAPEPAAWTWSELSASYQASLTEIRGTKAGRIKHPSVGTQDDVRLSLGKAAITRWDPLSINKLDPDRVERCDRRDPQEERPPRRSKALTYVKSAMNFARQMRRQSGITHATAWWTEISPPTRTKGEREKAKAKKIRLVDAKTYYSVDHLGELLVAHELISPGIRWGIWWVAYTANRRRSPTVLRRSELVLKDSQGRPGWGIAKWGDDEMKGQTQFWLPLPPAGAARRCLVDQGVGGDRQQERIAGQGADRLGVLVNAPRRPQPEHDRRRRQCVEPEPLPRGPARLGEISEAEGRTRRRHLDGCRVHVAPGEVRRRQLARQLPGHACVGRSEFRSVDIPKVGMSLHCNDITRVGMSVREDDA
jgi:hypothetical protein